MPSVGIDWIKAKLDTGAQTSALHAHAVEAFEREGAEWVRFRVRPWQASGDDETEVELPVHDKRRIRSSNGHTQERFVVLIPVVLRGREVLAEVTLTNRDAMGFRMLVGREALRHGFLVDSAKGYYGAKAPRAIRQTNRGD